MLTRRGFLAGLVAAPAVVRASSLMPVKPAMWVQDPLTGVLTYKFMSEAYTIREVAIVSDPVYPDAALYRETFSTPITIQPHEQLNVQFKIDNPPKGITIQDLKLITR